MRCGYVVLIMAWWSVLELSASAAVLVRDDFTDGNATDGTPSAWQGPPQITVVDDSMVIGGTGLAFATLARPGLHTRSDMSVRTRARLLEGAALAVVVRHGSQGNYNGGVFRIDSGQTLSQVAYLDRTGPLKEFGLVDVDFDVSVQDVMLQIDAFGHTIKLWAWPAGEFRPQAPLFSVTDAIHNFGTIAVASISEDYGGAGQLPTSAAFRFVMVADAPIPEPCSIAVAATFAAVLSCRGRRSRRG